MQNTVEHTNKLIHETSPYLLQHAHNPVNWHPWGEEALKQASEEDKLLIISVGYSACHWCHVMERESFEDSAVAGLMNEHYVSVKVDREERPDVDNVYMNAAYLITGRGGWPLNAIALPDGRPVFAGTYFPKHEWMNVLQYFARLYEEDPEKMREQAAKIVQGVTELDDLPVGEAKERVMEDDLRQAFKQLKSGIDYKKGGKSGAPKFPMPNIYEFLLKYYYHTKDEDALKAVEVTLDNIALGGIYDHLGGGFARYSTDDDWLVPHFEKMLYDNGQLVSLYSNAFRLTKKPLYKDVVYETLEFIERELTSPEGAFYAALDADSEGEEGKFYVWQKEEIDSVLGGDARWFSELYNIKPSGNWEHGKNILHLNEPLNAENKEKAVAAMEKLMKARDKKIRPGLDDKILTSWNALMLKGYVDAYMTFDEQKFLQKALVNGEFLWDKLHREHGNLFRNYKDGRATINGFLDDYAFTITAYIALYEATFDEKWLNRANTLTEYVIKHFTDEQTQLFFYVSDEDAELIARQKEISDNVISSSNSEMAKALYLLGTCYDNKNYLERADHMLTAVAESALDQPAFYANWASGMTWLVYGTYEVAIVGEQAEQVRKEMDDHYLPDVFYLGGRGEETLALLENKMVKGQTTIYVCREKVCKLPVTKVSEALKQID